MDLSRHDSSPYFRLQLHVRLYRARERVMLGNDGTIETLLYCCLPLRHILWLLVQRAVFRGVKSVTMRGGYRPCEGWRPLSLTSFRIAPKEIAILSALPFGALLRLEFDSEDC